MMPLQVVAMPRFVAKEATLTFPWIDSVDDHSAVVWSIRHRNLMWLREQYKQEQQRRFPDQPDRGMDRAFAEHIGLNVKYFGHIKQGRRNVGNGIARAVEAACGLPVGWMDHNHAEVERAELTDGERERRDAVAAFESLFDSDPEAARKLLLQGLADSSRRRATERAANESRSDGASGKADSPSGNSGGGTRTRH